MKFTLPFIPLALGLTTMHAFSQAPGPQDPPIVSPLAPASFRIDWTGTAARRYFIQTTQDLQTWSYSGYYAVGNGGPLFKGFAIQGSHAWVRLKYSDVASDDLDGDGISNADEVNFYGTDPFVNDDPDGDGYLTADELAAGTNPNLATSKPFDPTNPPPANRYVVPLSWWVENKFSDTMERLQLQAPAQIALRQADATAMADGSYDLPYTSIQAAVNAASAGEVIEVAPGTYAEAVDLTAKDVKLIGQRGSRENTIIAAPAGSPQALLTGAGNSAATTVSGLTLKNLSGAALRCQGGSTSRLHNLLIQGGISGIAVDAASPVIMGVVVDACTGTGGTDAALRITGNSQVRASHCTITDNKTTGGQVQVDGSAAGLVMVNSIVTNGGANNRAGGQIRLLNSGAATITYSSIRSGFTGFGNITSLNPDNPAALYFDTDIVSGGQRRLLRTCEAVDMGNPASLPGFNYWTRLDSDGEARRRAFGIAIRTSGTDIGADEYVSRLKFPIRNRSERGVVRAYSEVDEASDVATLGVLPNGNTKIAVINDETITDTTGTTHNKITFYEISPATGAIAANSEYPISRLDGVSDFETRDPEAISYDSVNRRLYVTTSHTKVNRYRDCEPTTYDPLIDPPSNDYDPRRAVVVVVQLDAGLVPTTKTYVDSRDGMWNQDSLPELRCMSAVQAGLSSISPVGFNSTNGLIATLRSQIQAMNSPVLGATAKTAGVLVVLNTVPKFGVPVNGVTYQPGQALPYNNANGLGGPGAGAGWVLSLPTNGSIADFPYWELPDSIDPAKALPAAGLQISNYRTSVGGPVVGLQANTTYYVKAWAYDTARNYGRGLATQATISNLRPLVVNEIYGAGMAVSSPIKASDQPDSVEFFNPSGQPINLSELRIQKSGGIFDRIPNLSDGPPVVPAVVPARGLYRMQAGSSMAVSAGISTFPYQLGNGSELMEIQDAGNLQDSYLFVRNQPKRSSSLPGAVDEGRVWDGGPAGKDFNFSATPARFENSGAYFIDIAEGTHRKTLGQANTSTGITNHTQGQGQAKFLQATHNHLQPGIFLHYANLGVEPAVWNYSPKQQDFHPISVEGLAVKSQTEMVVGLRSPLSNRTTGNALALVFSNANNAFLPAGGWTAAAGGFQSLLQLNLNGQGIRSIQWCPTVKNSAGIDGTYLIVGGTANGGPLRNETGRSKFSLYRWDGINAQPVLVVGDLAPYAIRPEGVNIINLNGEQRIVFVEDRYKAEGYDTQNGVHWPLTTLNLQ